MANALQSTAAQPAAGDSETTATAQYVPLGSEQLARLAAALEEAFTLDGLRQLLRTELAGGVSLNLEAIVAVRDRTLHDVCHDLVLWAMRDDRVGLHALLAAAQRGNPANHQLAELQQEWSGVIFTTPACPYPGMKSFTATEQGRFYGRAAEVRQAVERLRRYRFLAVLGPSGSGKSSILAAGILPALITSHYFADTVWRVQTMRPGTLPFDTLLSALNLPTNALDGAIKVLPGAEPGTSLLLVVDQYEELFAITAPGQRSRFEEALLLLTAVPDIYIIIAARADFYANLMASPLWEHIREQRLEIAPLRGDALREAITLPARDVGVDLEPQLVERLLADTGEEPGVLPFVQETLVMLWAHAEKLAIGLDAYVDLVGDKSGRPGLQVALANHADYVYLSVLAGDDERAVARRSMLRLIQFGEGRPDTRRQQTVDELRKGISNVATFDRVLAAMTANRLVTLSKEARQVDLSHEALIAGWPRLSAWIEQRRAAELTRRRLEEKASERQRLRRSDEAGGLLDAVELAEAEAWINGPDAAELGVSDELTRLATDSRKAIDASVHAKERAAERLRRRNQGLATALAAALIAVAVAIAFYFNAQNEAQNARNAQVTAQASALAAEQAARRAQAENLAAVAQLRMQRDNLYDDLTLLLARDAVLATWNSPDHYVTANADTALRDAVDGVAWRMTISTTPEQGSNTIYATALSPNNRYVATAAADGSVQLWDAQTGKPLRTLGSHRGGAFAVAFSPDGGIGASAGADGNVLLWDIQAGTQLQTLRGHSGGVFTIAFSPDGKTILSAGADMYAVLWDVQTGAKVRTFVGHSEQINAVAFSPDGQTIATAAGHFGRELDKTVRLWDVRTGDQLRILEEQFIPARSLPVYALAFSPDGATIAGAREERVVRLWNVGTGAVIHDFARHWGRVNAIAFSPDGKTIVSGADDHYVLLWDVETGAVLRTLSGHTGGVRAVVFSRDGGTIATSGSDGTVRLWDIRTGAQRHALDGHTAAVSTAAFSPDGRTIASGGDDRYIRLWNAETGEQLVPLTGHQQWIYTVAYSPDGNSIVSASRDGSVRLWDTRSQAELRVLLGHTGEVMAAAFSPGGRDIASAGADGTVRVWDAAAGKALRTFAGHEGGVNWAVYSPDGQVIASAGDDGTVRLWDAQSGKQLRTLRDHDGRVNSVTFSPDGRTVLSAGEDGGLLLWDVETGERLRAFAGHTGWVRAPAFSPDGRYIASGGGDGTVRLWDARTGAQLRRLTGHNGGVTSVAFSPDGKFIVSTCTDTTMRVWPATLDVLLDLAEQHIQRSVHELSDDDRRILKMTE